MIKFKYWLDIEYGYYDYEISCSKSEFRYNYNSLKSIKGVKFDFERKGEYCDVRYFSPLDNDWHFLGGFFAYHE